MRIAQMLKDSGDFMTKPFEIRLITVLNDYADDYGEIGLLEEIFPGLSIGELILDMYSAGLIPEDVLERFLTEE